MGGGYLEELSQYYSQDYIWCVKPTFCHYRKNQIRNWKIVLGKSMTRWSVCMYLVVFYFIPLGLPAEALKNYNTALQLNPNHTVALVNMGRQLRAAGNIREAEQAYKRFEWRYITQCRNYIIPGWSVWSCGLSHLDALVSTDVDIELFRCSGASVRLELHTW